MKKVTFQLAAYTAAAGKFDHNKPKEGNEDNFYVDDNLSDNEINHCIADELVTSSECGTLMVVADGMGGMNAGEIASEIAINTVTTFFSPGRITPSIALSQETRKSYLESTIIAADKIIKDDAKTNPSHKGMGSTIILAWLVGDELTVSWCGDSRCYRFNPSTGIELLSHDHSYVQELADKGEITYEETFVHPQNNIVTRCLGDPNGQAKPETRHFTVCNDDIIMLCSDGLSGVVFDRKYYLNNHLLSNDNLEDIIRANQNSMSRCREALFNAAEKADWYDNVTVILCKICNGADNRTNATDKPIYSENEQKRKKKPLWLIIIAILAIVVIAAILLTQKLCNKDNVKIDSNKDHDTTTILPRSNVEHKESNNTQTFYNVGSSHTNSSQNRISSIKKDSTQTKKDGEQKIPGEAPVTNQNKKNIRESLIPVTRDSTKLKSE